MSGPMRCYLLGMRQFSRIARYLSVLLCVWMFGSTLLGAQAGPGRNPDRPSQDPRRSETAVGYVVPIEGVVDFRMVALLRRGMSEALGAGASRLILDIDSPGGEVARMEEMIAMLQQLEGQPIDTVAFVRNQALSAGAVLALACKRIWVSPRATIGAAVPVMGGGLRGLVEDEVRNKYIAAFRAEFAKIAAHHGESVQRLAEAMVDERMQLAEIRYRGVDGLLRTEVREVGEVEKLRQTEGVEVLEETKLKMGPLVIDAREAVRFGVAEGQVSSLDELAREFGIAPEALTRVESNWSEELAGFLNSIRMFLLIGGVLMTIIALKAPGTGVPEALALLCFLFFFAGQFLVGLAEVTEILLFTGGIGLILVEFFLIPGTIVSGVIGFLCVVTALFLSLQSFGLPSNSLQDDVMTDNLTSLVIAILIVAVLAGLFSRLLPYIPFFNKLMLDATQSGGALSTTATSERAHSPMIGRRGIAVTDLRPAGRIEVDGEPLDVVSSGGFYSAGVEVEIVEVEGNRIAVVPVAQLESEGSAAAESGLVAIHWLVFMLFCGLLLLIAEVFFVSFGVLGTAAAVLTVTSVFMAFEHGTGVGSVFLGAVLVLVPITIVFAFRLLPRTNFGKRLILAGPTGKSTASDANLKDLIGRHGNTITPLRPVGTILVDGRRFDAMTRGEGLDADVDVEVLRVEMGQLIVRRSKQLSAQ